MDVSRYLELYFKCIYFLETMEIGEACESRSVSTIEEILPGLILVSVRNFSKLGGLYSWKTFTGGI